MTSVGCNRANDSALAQAKAEAEAARAEAAREKAEAKAVAAELATLKQRADAAEGELAKLKAPQSPPNPAVDSRKAAEWVLSIGGIVIVATGDKSIEVHGPEGKLPGEPFEIADIRLPGGNKVTNENIRNISGLRSVVALHATSGNKLTEFSFLNGMNNLRFVNLLFTDVDDASLGYLKDCPKLETLALGGMYQNHVTDDGIQKLKDMKFLVYLDILGTRATDIGLGHIKGLSSLTYLAMGNHHVRSDITDAGLANLAGMKKLETLIIANAGVTDAGLEHLKKLINLKRLRLERLNVTEAGVASLKAALPNCKIELIK
jgi:hypothetical protein